MTGPVWNPFRSRQGQVTLCDVIVDQSCDLFVDQSTNLIDQSPDEWSSEGNNAIGQYS
jgi:hypothetical protein